MNNTTTPRRCETCNYCKYPRTATDNGGACKCKLMQYKTIDIIVTGGGSPAWCPINRQFAPLVDEEATKKTDFVRDHLSPLLRAANIGVASANYEKDIATGEETVVVTYQTSGGGYQAVKKVCVTADSFITLTTDVISKL